jgi:hypothetical protein
MDAAASASSPPHQQDELESSAPNRSFFEESRQVVELLQRMKNEQLAAVLRLCSATQTTSDDPSRIVREIEDVTNRLIKIVCLKSRRQARQQLFFPPFFCTR